LYIKFFILTTCKPFVTLKIEGYFSKIEGVAIKLIFFKYCLIIVLFTLSLSACESSQSFLRVEDPPKYVAETKVIPPDLKDASCEKPAPVVEKIVPKAAPAKPVVALMDIYFAFDKYNIRPKDAAILRRNLEWFKANPGKRVRIEGHCDERGTVEYNLALGQKRADSAKAFLVSLGVNPELLETVSYGKERPFDPRHNQEAWARNRRAHFLPLDEGDLKDDSQ